ncbi:response regulator [Microvirga sp. KLBC 81]|uniref:response regulator n=1 Tax=Microvirga sp. KLBC 81 TaxID=1862707 RepID=UPI000D5094FA|nr:response regulator [Microvirga sp. KLBC 81]PVE21763.1 response regulator [Microvirga sp. KLBC 81]
MGRDVGCSRVALIVEDDKELRALAVALLEETDLRVVEASSAEEALQCLNYLAGEVAFLFADVRLPCLMSGVDLARTVRLKWPWIRTVLTSDTPLEEELDKALRHVRFMPKPWRPLELLMEAERSAEASRYEAIMSHPDTEVVGTFWAQSQQSPIASSEAFTREHVDGRQHRGAPRCR